jgi:putative ATPase
MDLFEQAHRERLEKEAPLAARMRPRTLDEYIGQEHIIGPGRLLRRAIQADQLGSLIFYGPPGTGKTTLARVIANTTRAHFIALNAVLSGVKDIRAAVAEAQDRGKHYGQRVILFVDEVHRFNKAQQDALLPWVENGTVIFIGATTENPYFEVNKALVSRSRIFQLTPLTRDDLRAIALQALRDPERGYGDRNVILDADALEHLVDVAGGDARGVLNALELAVETTEKQEIGDGEIERLEAGIASGDYLFSRDPISNLQSLISPSSLIHITLEIAEESIQRRVVLYDKEGDYHFDTISAFIKSLRGSDPDAAMYWLAKMIYAGEAPRFLFRRMLIFAGEDVGLADPNALGVVAACAEAFDRVGMPEGRFPLAQAALYLATAPKSNSAFALFDALAAVEQEADSGVPSHLRDASRDAEGFGHGEGYLYPHAYRDHWVAQQYLPTSLQGKVFYQPSDQGYEAGIAAQVARRREAQLAAMLEAEEEPAEMLTFSPPDSARDRWLQRTISRTGERLAVLRNRVLDGARLARHALALDIKAGSGLLTWETLRRAPEGGVYALARSQRDAEALAQMARDLDKLTRPRIMSGALMALPDLLAKVDGGDVRFDAIVGFNGLLTEPDKPAAIRLLAARLAPGGVLSLAERVPRHTQRLYHLLDLGGLDADLAARLAEAEEAIYAAADDPLVNWDADDLAAWLAAVGLEASIQVEDERDEMPITPGTIVHWFGPGSAARPSYAGRLAARLDAEEIEIVHRLFERQLAGRSVQWRRRVAYVQGRATKGAG